MYPKQSEAIFEPKDCNGDPARYSLIEASTKAGKAQPLDAIVWTPSGPKRMGDLQLGEKVLTPGGTAPISGIYPQGERPIYQLRFSDGSLVEADEEHLWEVQSHHFKDQIVSTRELAQWPQWKLKDSWVPELECPAQFKSRPVPVDPYLLGVLIGDGSLSQGLSFSSKDLEIVEAVRKALPAGHYLRKETNPTTPYDYYITAGAKGAAHREAGTHLRGILARMGLTKKSHEKRIPPEYRYNSVVVRKAVLQGIFDTDGWVDKKIVQPCLDQTSELLAQDVAEIIQSLGGSVTQTKKNAGYKRGTRYIACRKVYSQRIRLRDASWCFRLPRKARLITPRKKSPARRFRSVEFIGHKPAQCIEIIDPKHLYLTNGFIPTHNTVACIAWLYEQAYTTGAPNKNYWWVAPVSGQAKIAFRRLKAFLPPDQIGDTNEQDMTITLPNGALIWFKSADKPDSLYGEDVWAAVIDEASRAKEEAWYAVRSTLTATRGPCRMIGNVKGRRNWFYNMARKAEAGEANMSFHRIVAQDAVSAGVLDADEIRDAKSKLPEAVFKELYLAEAGDDGGNPFGLDHIARCVVPQPNGRKVYNWGWDLAKSHDWTVGVGLDDAGKVAQLHRWQKPWLDTIRDIIRISGNLTPALIDATGVGDPIVEMLQKNSLNFEGYVFNPNSKQRLMEGLAVAIQSGETSVVEGVHRLEMEAFEYTFTNRVVRYSAPEGYHDDTVCAHALAVSAKAKGIDMSLWEKLVRH